MVSTIWGICFSLKANPCGSNAKSFDTVLPRSGRARKPSRSVCSTVDSVFEFSQIRHHGIKRRRFSKEHLPHVPVVASNLCNVGFRRAYSKAPGFGQIVPRCGFSEENLLVLDYACEQANILDRKLPVLVPVQTGEVIVVPREARRHLA